MLIESIEGLMIANSLKSSTALADLVVLGAPTISRCLRLLVAGVANMKDSLTYMMESKE